MRGLKLQNKTKRTTSTYRASQDFLKDQTPFGQRLKKKNTKGQKEKGMENPGEQTGCKTKSWL